MRAKKKISACVLGLLVFFARHSSCLLPSLHDKRKRSTSIFNHHPSVVGWVPLNRKSLPPLGAAPVDDVKDRLEMGAVTDVHSFPRFSGVGRLYTQPNGSEGKEDAAPGLESSSVVERLAKSTVAVVGLGGVGSWAAEALCRSGVGNLILIDLDDICISNTNRQVMAMSSTVGKMKIDEMRKRILDINPNCNVTNIHDFVTLDNTDSIMGSLLPELDVCLDAIDGQHEKAALLAACATKGVPIVTCGGAAGRKDPSQIVCDDITKAEECRLLFKCRKRLRKFYGFKKGPGQGQKNNHKVKPWNIMAVFSREKQKMTPSEGNDVSSLRRCDGALGTACFVTGTYGFVAASKVVDMIARDSFVIPRR